MKVAIIKVQSHPQGVAIQVIAGEDIQADGWLLDCMVVQTADGSLQLNWSVAKSPWRPWRPGEHTDAVLDLSNMMEDIVACTMPIAEAVWKTLPTYKRVNVDAEVEP